MKTYLICFSLLIALPRFIPAATFNIADGDVAALKAAIATANTNNQTNTINLATNGSYILNGADDGINGLPVIQGTANNFPLTVNGNGSVIIRNPALGTSSFRIMKIDCPTGTSVQVYLDHHARKRIDRQLGRERFRRRHFCEGRALHSPSPLAR